MTKKIIELDCGFFRIVRPEATIRHWDHQRRCAELIRDEYERSRALKLHSAFDAENVQPADANIGDTVYDETEPEQQQQEDTQETRKEEKHEGTQETRKEETHEEKRRATLSQSCIFDTKRRCCI